MPSPFVVFHAVSVMIIFTEFSQPLSWRRWFTISQSLRCWRRRHEEFFFFLCNQAQRWGVISHQSRTSPRLYLDAWKDFLLYVRLVGKEFFISWLSLRRRRQKFPLLRFVVRPIINIHLLYGPVIIIIRNNSFAQVSRYAQKLFFFFFVCLELLSVTFLFFCCFWFWKFMENCFLVTRLRVRTGNWNERFMDFTSYDYESRKSRNILWSIAILIGSNKRSHVEV